MWRITGFLTSAGGAASAELALELISQDFGLQMANQVAELCVRPPKATPEDRQRSPLSSVMGTGNRGPGGNREPDAGQS